MNEEEMHDVNGGFWGWSKSKFRHNMGVIVSTMFTAIKWMFGIAGVTAFSHVVSQFFKGHAVQATLSSMASGVAKASTATLKGLYGVLSSKWAWVLGIGGAVAIILGGIVLLGYVKL